MITNIDMLHKQVWTRFVRMPYGHVLDYADQNGNTVIPTAEECKNALPNVLGWGVSIENGAFFSGLYLYGLCEKYDKQPGEQLRKEINIIANGLLILCDVADTDGCIVRGVADDGKSHYPFSSEDQFGPWLLGLWRLMRSSSCSETLRRDIAKRMIRSLNGIHAAGWLIPTEWPGVTRGTYIGRDWRGVTKLLFSAAAACELGLLERSEFDSLAEEKPAGSIYTRYEIVSHGFAPDMIRDTSLIQFWIDICAQLCAHALITLDGRRALYYRRGCENNGIAVTEFFGEYKKYIAEEDKTLSYNWRVLLDDVRPWRNADEAVSEAGRQIGLFFRKYSPGMHAEKKYLGQAIFACWIAVVSGDRTAARHAYECLCEIIGGIDWAACGYSFAFAAEAAAYCYEGLWEEL